MTEENESAQKHAVFDLKELQRPDGIISRMVLNNNRENSGVLVTAMRSIEKNEDYRQELKTGFFTSPRKQMQMVLAINEMRECGIDETMVIDLLLAQKAGINGGLLHDILEALTHTTFSTNYTGKNKDHWWNKGNNGSNSNSPIS